MLHRNMKPATPHRQSIPAPLGRHGAQPVPGFPGRCRAAAARALATLLASVASIGFGALLTLAWPPQAGAAVASRGSAASAPTAPGLSEPRLSPPQPAPQAAPPSAPPRLAAAPAAATVLPRLPALSAARQGTTVSGLSSGAYMAGQFHVAYAESLAGAAVLAGGPYACARGSAVVAAWQCSCPASQGSRFNPWPGLSSQGCRVPSPNELAVRADEALRRNRPHLDNPAALRQQRVWLMAGDLDTVVPPALVQAQADFYRRQGVPAEALHLRTVARAAHGLPAPGGPVACDVTASPFLTQCRNTDAPGELLAWLYAPAPARLAPPVAARPEGLIAFDQRPYRRPGVVDGLDDSGWLYLPAACRQEAGCRVHVVFHGCGQGQGFVGADGQAMGTRFVQGAGYNRWAEANRIVLLYPQVKAQTGAPGALGSNPQGCWDFWGYTSPGGAVTGSLGEHLRRQAPQLRAVKAMVDALLAPRP